MTKIPSDNHIRAMLDPVSADAFQPAFDAAIGALEAGGGLAPFQRKGAPPSTSTESSGVPSPQICPWNSRPSSSS
jgi:hypothetical protein